MKYKDFVKNPGRCQVLAGQRSILAQCFKPEEMQFRNDNRVQIFSVQSLLLPLYQIGEGGIEQFLVPELPEPAAEFRVILVNVILF